MIGVFEIFSGTTGSEIPIFTIIFLYVKIVNPRLIYTEMIYE